LIGSAGYIKLDGFTPGAAKEVENAMSRLKKVGAKGIILDLRENLGGLMFEAVNIVNLFVPKGQEVVSTKGKSEDWNKTYRTLSQPVDLDIPLVILVGRSSASDSEIVAGALQDYDRAILVGERTFGKGLVQTTRQLPYNAQLKVTTAKYYIPSGRCIQALDYTNRKSDGTVSRVADSLKAEFKTKNGRKVYDGGGLDPDIRLDQEADIPVLAGLFFDDYFFEYANLYCSKNTQQGELKNLIINDKDYSDFTDWLKANKFNYTSDLEVEVDRMMELAVEGGLNNDVIDALKALKTKIEGTKQLDLIRYKDLIKEALTEEIGFHYALHKGRFEVSFSHDKELQTGIKILSDPLQFKKILVASNGSDSKP
jgi:carboxyl-terminal processing protease